MKIRQRLALRFTMASALLTGAILTITFIITRRVVHSDFLDRLSQQSRLEVVHYATPDVREVIDPGSYLLVNPSVSIYSSDGKLLYSQGNTDIPRAWIDFMQENESFDEERKNLTSVGRKYAYQGGSYIVFVSARDVSAEHELDILMKSMVVGWAVSLVLSYIAGFYYSADTLQPIKHVVNDVNTITEDNLSYRLKMEKEVSEIDELDELVLTFNALLSRIENAFVAQKRFVQHASHELKTPLTAIMAEAELALAKDRNPVDYKRTLSVILKETERLVSTTQGLLTLARLEERTYSTELEYVDILAVCEGVVKTTRLHHPQRYIDFKKGPISLYIYGNRQLLEIAVMNVIDNAIKYSSEEIRIDAQKADGQVVLSVSDKGLGIPPADLEKIKTPLFRGSNVSNFPGAGLGLSLVDRILTVLKGRSTFLSEEGKGTTCVLTLPMKEPRKA